MKTRIETERVPRRALTTWREEVLQECDRVELDFDRSKDDPDSPNGRFIAAELTLARQAATRISNWRQSFAGWWTGVDANAGWRAVHAAKQALIESLSDSDLRAQLPILRSKVMLYLDAKDPERVAYEEWLKVADAPNAPVDRERLRTVRTAVDGTSDAHFDKIHRFRNTLYILFVGVLILDLLLALGNRNGTWLPICAPPTVLGGQPACPSVWHVEVAGVIGGVLAAAAALLRIPVTHEPYNLKRAQTLVKLPLSALTAIVGLMLLQSSIIDALQPQDSPIVLVYAVVFGYSQQLVTRLIDQKAKSLVSSDPEQQPSS
jgi:hypothetical protein